MVRPIEAQADPSTHSSTSFLRANFYLAAKAPGVGPGEERLQGLHAGSDLLFSCVWVNVCVGTGE